MIGENGNEVFFIGAGPGSPGCLTVDGLAALERCGLVYAFEPYPETFSRLLAGKRVLDPFTAGFSEIVAQVEEALSRHCVGFLVPGDMTVFSPFMPLALRLGPRARVIPGVGIVNAAAALLGRTLDAPSVSSTVVLASLKHLDRDGSAGDLGRLAALGGTLVLYMVNRPLALLAGELASVVGGDMPVAVLSRIGLPGGKVYEGTLATIAGLVGEEDVFGQKSGDPSMAVIIVGRALTAEAAPNAWDHRKEGFAKRKRGRG